MRWTCAHKDPLKKKGEENGSATQREKEVYRQLFFCPWNLIIPFLFSKSLFLFFFLLFLFFCCCHFLIDFTLDRRFFIWKIWRLIRFVIYPPASETHEKGLDFCFRSPFFITSGPWGEYGYHTKRENYNSVRCRYPILTVVVSLLTGAGNLKQPRLGRLKKEGGGQRGRR